LKSIGPSISPANLSHSALVAGQIESLSGVYREPRYAAILHHNPFRIQRRFNDQVKPEYAEQFNVEVKSPLGFENTLRFWCAVKTPRRVESKTISQAAQYAPQWRAGLARTACRALTAIPDSRAYMACVLPAAQRNALEPNLHGAGFI